MKLDNNTIRRFVMAALMALTGTLAAEAESLPIRVTVPFAFTANGNVMPAGEYTIRPINGVSGAVVLHGMMAGNANMIALSMPGSDAMVTPSLVFAEADAGKALSLISAPGWSVKLALPKKLTLARRLEVTGIVAMVRAR